jgi:rubrerythrin
VNALELGTFGAVLRFALELEAAMTALYKSALGHTTNPKLKQLAEGFIQRGEKRVQLLMRLRRENTTEMLLEPITGLDSEKFRPQTELSKGAGDASLTKLASAMETKLQAFYTAAAEKVSFLSEAAGAFERLAEENTENARRLQTLS